MTMVKTPPYLNAGDTIGIVCPAGYMPAEKVQACIDTLHAWGYHVKTGMTVGSDSENYFSGTDRQRLDDFQEMLDDDKINAVLCGRGGYGLTRIIDKINFLKFTDHPKWIIGFSDITILQSHIFSNYGISTLHAPMANAFNDDEGDNIYLLSLKKALEGKKIAYSVAGNELNVKGEAIGELVGGNLALLAHAIGTASDIKTKGKILFLEDTGEYLYNIDRMLYQLKRAGKFDKLAGLIFGGFTDLKDTQRPFGTDITQIIKEMMDGYDFPVCFDFPVGHAKENYALKIGAGYKLKVGKKKVTLTE
jgi:muramoyltetrapeptide carboxypeptidase